MIRDPLVNPHAQPPVSYRHISRGRTGLGATTIFPPHTFTEGVGLVDIFDAPPVLPEIIYICGSGPSLPQGEAKIPYEAYTIALNSAACYSRPWSLWIAFDHRVPDYEWWDGLHLGPETQRLFGARLANRLALQPAKDIHRPYTVFRYHPVVDDDTPVECYLQRGVLKGGMNVLGVALQYAYWFGARDIRLTGVDLRGTGHWDGFENKDALADEWHCVARLTKLVTVIQATGVCISALTPTALPVPRTSGGQP